MDSHLINLSLQAYQLTEHALDNARNDEWNEIHSLIEQRDAIIRDIHDKVSYETSSIQQKIRNQLETIADLNNHLIEIAKSHQQVLMNKKSSAAKSKSAINSYLDNS